MDLMKGELYFVREVDFHTKKYTNFVKIGLVRDKEGRSSLDRLKEHQTGNPRELDLPEGNIVYTDAINRVEALMHNFYLNKRVSGEWFEFSNEEEINQAKKKAIELAEQVKACVPIFEKASKLEKTKDNKAKKAPSEKILAWAKADQVARSEIKVLKGLSQSVEEALKTAESSGEDVKNVTETRERKQAGKFDLQKFAEENATLYKQYLTITASFSHRFLTKLKPIELENLDKNFQEYAEEQTVQIEECTSSKNFEKLIELNLDIRRQLAIREWDSEVAQANMKILCDKYQEVEGVCTWKRDETESEKFEESKFKQDFPEVYSSYFTEGKTVKFTKPVKKKLS